MKSVVVFKWAVDPKDLRVNADGTIDWSTASPWTGDDDYVAIQAACDAAGENGEVIGLTLSGGDVAYAAARGAHRTIAIEGLPSRTDAAVMAQVLAAAVRTISDVDVVMIGDSAWEPAVPVMLAGLLGWPALMAVESVRRNSEGLSVIRRFGTGTQTVEVKGAVVLGAAAKREEENKPGMRAVITARKKPVVTWDVKELISGYAPSFESCGTNLPETEPSKVFDGSEPDLAVEQLLWTMKAEGVL